MALIAVSLVIPSGCGFKDIDKRFFVVSVGIDKPRDPNKKFKVELKLAIPSGQERFGSNKYIIVSVESNTLTEAVRLAKSKVDKELDFGHAKAIVFGNDLFDEGTTLPEVMDWIARRRDIQMISWMGIGKPDALGVLSSNPQSERLPSNMLFMIFGQTGTETAYIVSEYLFDFYRRMNERGLDPILPIIETRDKDQLSVNTMTVFNKERRVLDLQPRETLILNNFYQGLSKTEILVKSGDIDLVLSAAKVKSNFTITGADSDKPVIHTITNVTASIEESKTPVSLDDLPKYEKAAEQLIEQRVAALFKKLQKAGVDPVGFGLRYRATHRVGQKEWDRWTAVYPNIEFETKSECENIGNGDCG
ncbi:Ger(x)C family spore germination protein [Gordoniibacillus kamchatkensis]|uniref:Ger(x)C family spore germination protein n=1 Tax=Gordoniibacillus kamchatkensis TaxID=1590651 RepID=UPI000698C43A|nr:Ger(x)C family spore germination protein [Paenibacillus sp. VKM B-2647]